MAFRKRKSFFFLETSILLERSRRRGRCPLISLFIYFYGSVFFSPPLYQFDFGQIYHSLAPHHVTLQSPIYWKLAKSRRICRRVSRMRNLLPRVALTRRRTSTRPPVTHATPADCPPRDPSDLPHLTSQPLAHGLHAPPQGGRPQTSPSDAGIVKGTIMLLFFLTDDLGKVTKDLSKKYL